MKKAVLFVVLPLLLCLSGCMRREEAPAGLLCRVVLEEGEGFTGRRYVGETEAGGVLRFSLQELDGYTITGADYDGCVLEREQGGGVTLTLPGVRYSRTVRLTVERSGITLAYRANGGERLDGGDPAEAVELPVTPSHRRLNTSTGADLFTREGCTLLGWNTRPDGSGTSVGLGSRVDPAEGLTLYAQWSPWSDAALFRWEPLGDGVTVTAYLGNEKVAAIPAELDGLPVRAIAAGAFAGAACDTVILPAALWSVEDGAFAGAALSTLYLFDNIRKISDYSFEGCENLQTLHINAARAPVYSGTYYATFADKFDRLLDLRDSRKIVLFSGSSARFGYDSAAIDAAFPEYGVVNMGVFAYTNALPQLELIRTCMGAGDILLHSPEFDAAQRQFCATNNLDAPFFNMMEANYDMAALLELRQYGQVFTAFSAFLESREGMEARSYALSPSAFDEDGDPVDTPSYNEYGDYILYRPNSADEAPIYGLPVDYTAAGYPKAAFIDPANREYSRFLAQGVRVYVTYAPRNRLAVSGDSTRSARAELDAYLRENLCVPVISDIEDSLVSGVWLYGTDNHLSTEGAAIRTGRIIRELKAQLETEGAAGR